MSPIPNQILIILRGSEPCINSGESSFGKSLIQDTNTPNHRGALFASRRLTSWIASASMEVLQSEPW